MSHAESLTDRFPAAFDAEFYKSTYADLRAVSAADAEAHYFAHGRREGRVASLAAVRAGLIAAIPTESHALEIGPFFSPCLHGANVRYFDVQDAAGLRARAHALGHASEHVPKVIHYVSADGDLSVVERQFDVVLSCHSVEHTTDLVKHLGDVQALLRPGGAYALIVPDRRFCFDALLPESTIADVLEAYIERRRRHRISDVIAHLTLTTHNDPIRHWAGDHADAGDVAARATKALEVLHQHGDRYIDVHAWRFTPDSFRAVCETLYAMGLSGLRPARVYDTPHDMIEFCAVLHNPA